MGSNILKKLGKVNATEALSLFLGSKIGEGEFRTVYECDIAPDFVVKVEKGLPASNIAEFELWHAAARQKNGKWAAWLAPCQCLSYNGSVLLQRRCQPLKDASELPERVPNFLDDAKLENWGRFDGRVVCLDYGWHKALKLMLGLGKLVNHPRKASPGLGTRRWGTPLVDTRGARLSARKKQPQQPQQ